ncbi:MAG: MBL fold metallo-hydrolase [Corynebacterium sp.]|nr:MBL fold metallo-hydrolase [Corynebacterium sp.]
MTDSHNDLHYHQISVSEMDNNVYLLCSGDEGLLIDAADNADAILALAERAGVRITKVLTTHRHWDHVRALPKIIEKTGATHFAPYLDAPAMPVAVDVELHDKDTISFGGHNLTVRILRGHTPGGASLHAHIGEQDHLFVGDSLFPGGVGKTSTEGEFKRLFNDVKDHLFDVYPDETIVHPGHGDDTTLGAERPNLDTWWDRKW